MTNDRNKIYWNLNWILCAIVFVVLACVLCYRYYVVGHPVEATWVEEICKYIVMWIILTVGCWTVAWVPFKALSSYIAKKRSNTDE